MYNLIFWATVALLSAYSHVVFAVTSNQDNQILAPGYGPLTFTAPSVGSYKLPVLGQASDGQVVDTEGKGQSLLQLMQNKVVLLSFIYSTCNDVNGCPLATSVLHKVKKRLSKESQITNKVRLLTLSFNPEFDTPQVMKHYAEGLQSGNLDWRFLTTKSEQQLLPILDKYQQSRQQEYNEKGEFTGTYSHILRVFLIDQKHQFRNIYSVSFLHPDTLVNDIKTLLLERPNNITKPTRQPLLATSDNNLLSLNPLYQAGDLKSGYDTAGYKTQSLALKDRVGEKLDLLTYINQPPLGLPPLKLPEDNPVTPEKIHLGRKLFYDRRLSLNNTFSCAMCHIPEQGFTSNEMATAVGIEGRTVKRNAPTLYNVAYAELLFHDGRENTLEQQVWGPLLATNEMANPSIAYVINKIKTNSDYDGLFEQAFNRGPNMETIGMAIANYQRTLNSGNSTFDRWFYQKKEQALSQAAQRGFQLFQGKAACAGCHLLGKNYALFMDNKLHNTGLGYQEAMLKQPEKQKVQLAPGIFVEVDTGLINSVAEQKQNDLGRYEVTQDPKDRWAYKTPTLRNIALTAPYMHNGVFLTLRQVIEFYNQGGVANKNLDSKIKPLNLSNQDMIDLEAFLNCLTGDNVEDLVSDAFSVPIGDVQ